jgi:ribosomal protein L11 methyltransferase
MFFHILFEIKKIDKEKAITFLEHLSEHALYQIEEGKTLYLGGFFKSIPQELPDYLSSFSLKEDQIDWQDQWQQFSPTMSDDLFILDLSQYESQGSIKLKPGPGFGDLSHETTSLCLTYLARNCQGNEIIDFGCGSGILSVAAYAFQASNVYSIEIDNDSINHTKENLRLNGFSDAFVFESLPHRPYSESLICVINMTFGEQKVALQDVSYFPKNTTFISSGILKSQLQPYLQWGKTKNIEFQKVNEKGQWILLKGIFVS